MELTQALWNIGIMKIKQENLFSKKEQTAPYDFSKLKFDLVSHHMISCVQFLFGKDPELLRSYDFHSILSLRHKHLVSKKDAKKIIEQVMHALKKEENIDFYFHEYFPGDYEPKRNRIRALVNNPTVTFISKEKEEYVISLFHRVFELQLQEHLHVISEQELYIAVTPYLLEIIDIEETSFSKLDFLIHLHKLFHTDIPVPIQQLLYYWYQENQYSFVEDVVDLSFPFFEALSFVLNKSQKLKFIQRFETLFMERFYLFQEEVQSSSQYNYSLVTNLSSLEKDIKSLLSIKNSL